MMMMTTYVVHQQTLFSRPEHSSLIIQLTAPFLIRKLINCDFCINWFCWRNSRIILLFCHKSTHFLTRGLCFLSRIQTTNRRDQAYIVPVDKLSCKLCFRGMWTNDIVCKALLIARKDSISP